MKFENALHALRARPHAILVWVLAALWQQKLRSALALSGVALGVAGCLIALSVGEAAKRGVVEQLEGMGLANVYLRATSAGDAAGRELAHWLTQAQVSALAVALDDARIAPIARLAGQPLLVGVTPVLHKVLDIGVAEGRLIGDADMHDAQLMCVIPWEWAQAERMRLGGVVQTPSGACAVTGILRAGDVGTLRLALALPQDTMRLALVALPRVADAQGKPLAQARLSEAIIGFADAKAAENAPVWLSRTLKALGLEGSVDVISPAAQVRRAMAARSLLERLQLAFGLALLLVAGFGVMNLMLATVGERQPEIGLRRAVGASQAAILAQFLLEAVAICLLGGAVGVALGLSGLLLAMFAGVAVSLGVAVVVLPLVSASVAGVVFGVFPAWRASRVEPLSALQGAGAS